MSSAVSVEGRLGTSLGRGHFTHLGVAASLHTCYDVVHENIRVFFHYTSFPEHSLFGLTDNLISVNRPPFHTGFYLI